MNSFTKQIYQEYMQWVDEVSEECDWKTHFTPEEIVEKVVSLVMTKLETQNSH